MIDFLDVALPTVEKTNDSILSIAFLVGAVVVLGICILLIVLKNKKEK